MDDAICPTKNSHPFWSSHVGSSLHLRISEPADSQIKGLDISVYTESPLSFKISVFLSNENYTLDFLTKKQSRDFLKNEWMNYYKDTTIVTYRISTPVDMSKFGNSLSISLSNSRSSSREASPRIANTPRSNSPDITPRSRSRDSSPRSSPREWFQKRLSLQLRRSKHVEYDLSASSSTDSSPRNDDSPSPKRNDDLRRSIHRANSSSSPRSAESSPRNSPRNDSSRERKKKLFEELLKKKRFN
jgi:hypothetical protein